MVCLWCKGRFKWCSSLKMAHLPISWHWFSVHILQLLNTLLARKLEILVYVIKICNWTWMWKHFSRSSFHFRNICFGLGCIKMLHLSHQQAWSAPQLQEHHFLKAVSGQYESPWLAVASLHLLSQFMNILYFGILDDFLSTHCKIFLTLNTSNPQIYHSVQSS